MLTSLRGRQKLAMNFASCCHFFHCHQKIDSETQLAQIDVITSNVHSQDYRNDFQLDQVFRSFTFALLDGELQCASIAHPTLLGKYTAQVPNRV